MSLKKVDFLTSMLKQHRENCLRVDVRGPDVDVEMKEKTIKVPDVDVDIPEENENEVDANNDGQ
ncbi:MAG: hypothetical protein R3C11_11505 [Planctomycetaceae bacterium]